MSLMLPRSRSAIRLSSWAVSLGLHGIALLMLSPLVALSPILITDVHRGKSSIHLIATVSPQSSVANEAVMTEFSGEPSSDVTLDPPPSATAIEDRRSGATELANPAPAPTAIGRSVADSGTMRMANSAIDVKEPETDADDGGSTPSSSAPATRADHDPLLPRPTSPKRAFVQRSSSPVTPPLDSTATVSVAPVQVNSPPANGAESFAPVRPIPTNPVPQYPVSALAVRQQGTVILSVTVAADGGVAAIAVADSSGFAILDQAALAAVARWRFTAAKRNDQAIVSTILVPIVFRIR